MSMNWGGSGHRRSPATYPQEWVHPRVEAWVLGTGVCVCMYVCDKIQVKQFFSHSAFRQGPSSFLTHSPSDRDPVHFSLTRLQTGTQFFSHSPAFRQGPSSFLTHSSSDRDPVLFSLTRLQTGTQFFSHSPVFRQGPSSFPFGSTANTTKM